MKNILIENKGNILKIICLIVVIFGIWFILKINKPVPAPTIIGGSFPSEWISNKHVTVTISAIKDVIYSSAPIVDKSIPINLTDNSSILQVKIDDMPSPTVFYKIVINDEGINNKDWCPATNEINIPKNTQGTIVIKLIDIQNNVKIEGIDYETTDNTLITTSDWYLYKE